MRLHRVLPFALIVSLAGAACGAAEVVAPRLALKKAAAQLGDDRRASFTLSFAGDEADAVALFSTGEDDVTAEDTDAMRLLFNSRLSVAMDSGADSKSADDDESAFDLKIGDLEHAAEFRQVDGTLYARADVRKLLDTFGGDVDDLESFLPQAREMGLGFIDQAVAGEWVALELGPLESFFKGLAGNGGEEMFGGVTPDALNLDLFKGLMNAVAGAYGSDVDVKELGGDDAGDHYRLTASARRLYERLLPELEKLPLFGMGGPITPDDAPDSSEVPDEKYSLDVWVKDGRIARAEFDIAQFAPAADRPDGPVVLRVDISRRPDGISAPSGAEKIDFFELWGKFAGSMAEGLEGLDEGIFSQEGEEVPFN